MFNLRLIKTRKRGIARDQSGFTLVEVVIAIALLGIIVAALANGLGTASNVLLKNDTRQTAKNLAETQMESVKNQPFVPGATTYPLASILPPQQGVYTATITVVDGSNPTVFDPLAIPSQGRDSSLQKIIVKIFKSGVLVYTLEGYKVE
jgi:prepilin-type N-terminal cleavage/methylation domain-containing protein